MVTRGQARTRGITTASMQDDPDRILRNNRRPRNNARASRRRPRQPTPVPSATEDGPEAEPSTPETGVPDVTVPETARRSQSQDIPAVPTSETQATPPNEEWPHGSPTVNPQALVEAHDCAAEEAQSSRAPVDQGDKASADTTNEEDVPTEATFKSKGSEKREQAEEQENSDAIEQRTDDAAPITNDGDVQPSKSPAGPRDHPKAPTRSGNRDNQSAANDSEVESSDKRAPVDDPEPAGSERQRTNDEASAGGEGSQSTPSACENLRTSLEAWRARAANVPALHGSNQLVPNRDVVDNVVYQAIASVTEAVTERGNFEYSLLDRVDVALIRPGADVLHAIAQDSRTGGEGVGHWSLYHIYRDHNNEQGRYVARHYDSSRGQRESQHFVDQAWKIVQNILVEQKWTEDRALLPVSPTTPAVQRNQGDCWTCGLFTIFFAWVQALGLTLSLQQGPALHTTQRFRSDACAIVRLAMRGHVDSETIRNFLVCYGFIEHDAHVPEARAFARTFSFPTEHDVSERVRRVKDRQAKDRCRRDYEAVRAGDESMPEFETLVETINGPNTNHALDFNTFTGQSLLQRYYQILDSPGGPTRATDFGGSVSPEAERQHDIATTVQPSAEGSTQAQTSPRMEGTRQEQQTNDQYELSRLPGLGMYSDNFLDATGSVDDSRNRQESAERQMPEPIRNDDSTQRAADGTSSTMNSGPSHPPQQNPAWDLLRPGRDRYADPPIRGPTDAGARALNRGMPEISGVTAYLSDLPRHQEDRRFLEAPLQIPEGYVESSSGTPATEADMTSGLHNGHTDAASSADRPYDGHDDHGNAEESDDEELFGAEPNPSPPPEQEDEHEDAARRQERQDEETRRLVQREEMRQRHRVEDGEEEA